MPNSTRAVVLVMLLLAACALSCRRRAPGGTCADHVDCEAGFDCVGGRCVKREGFPGSAAPAVPKASETAAIAAQAQAPPAAAPSSVDGGDGSALETAPKMVPAPTPSTPPAAEPEKPPPPADRLPLWKQRLKNG